MQMEKTKIIEIPLHYILVLHILSCSWCACCQDLCEAPVEIACSSAWSYFTAMPDEPDTVDTFVAKSIIAAASGATASSEIQLESSHNMQQVSNCMVDPWMSSWWRASRLAAVTWVTLISPLQGRTLRVHCCPYQSCLCAAWNSWFQLQMKPNVPQNKNKTKKIEANVPCYLDSRLCTQFWCWRHSHPSHRSPCWILLYPREE